MRSLTDLQTDKVLNLRLEDNVLISQSGKLGKLKETSKEFSSKNEAKKALVKKEWEALKKGFVLRNLNAKKGEATLHKFIGGGYTGALAFESIGDEIFIYKSSNQSDYLAVIDKLGKNLREIALPKPLAWSINRQNENLLMDLDHDIFRYEIKQNSFKNLSEILSCDDEDKSVFMGFADSKKDKIVILSRGKIFITNLKDEILLTRDYKTTTINGKIPFCAAVSADASLLALHTNLNEIKLIDTKSGKVVSEISTRFKRIEHMKFVREDKFIVFVARDEFIRTKVVCVKIDSGDEVQSISANLEEITSICVSDEGDRLAVIDGLRAYVFSALNFKELLNFELEHIVKSCEAKFIDGNLGVRTDYGCFSIYKI
ncbi:hypothetical protein [Campylobacter sp.]|uniref:hypothetical protein n=1 Tax=Campylobacter sp. TaxID=205 RepID=UPI0027090DD4|nr:hypothetical protein [Campylobacter sp.]